MKHCNNPFFFSKDSEIHNIKCVILPSVIIINKCTDDRQIEITIVHLWAKKWDLKNVPPITGEWAIFHNNNNLSVRVDSALNFSQCLMIKQNCDVNRSSLFYQLEWSAPRSTCVTCQRLVRISLFLTEKRSFIPIQWAEYFLNMTKKSVEKSLTKKSDQKVWPKSVTDRQTTDKKKVIAKCPPCYAGDTKIRCA